jgi:multiple sugar transport system permease protein
MNMPADRQTLPAHLTRFLRRWYAPSGYLSWRAWDYFCSGLLNLMVIGLLVIYLFPILFMLVTAFTPTEQLGDRYAPVYPARQVRYTYEGKEYRVYNVPLPEGMRQLALVKPGPKAAEFIDPQDPEAGRIYWEGSWRTLRGVYKFSPTLENFDLLFGATRFPRMLQNSLALVVIGEIAVLVSSTIVAYGFSRFPLPGGNLLFYVLIATILIPEKVTLIPTYFMYVRVLDWNGSWLPLLVPLFFGNAVYIFLLRQNFKSIPKDLDEAAMLDGAGPLRILFSVVLPQSWPVVITVGLLHFYYAWNETRQAALYLGTRPDLAPVSFGVQNFQSLAPIQNVLQASALLVMIIPVIVLFLSQRYFMRDMLITGLEK